jgi:hypothetical protein
MDTGQVAERVETRPNRPVPSLTNKLSCGISKMVEPLLRHLTVVELPIIAQKRVIKTTPKGLPGGQALTQRL